MPAGSAPQPAGNNEMPMDETHKRADDVRQMATDPRQLDRGSEVYYHDGLMHYDTDSEPERAGRGWSAAMPDGQGGIGPKSIDMKIESENDGNLESEPKKDGLFVVP